MSESPDLTTSNTSTSPETSSALPTTEQAFAQSLGYPDYRRFSRSGEEGRILETKLIDAPKIFCPIVLDVEIHLDKSRNSVPLMEAEVPEVIRGYLGISEDLIIDVLPQVTANRVFVTLRALPVPPVAAGHRGVSRVHHVSLEVAAVEDSLDDSLISRRAEIVRMFVSNAHADSLVLCLPQLWLIPDPEFKTKLPTLPVYPNSALLLFFKNLFGHISAARLLFKHTLANMHNSLALVLQFKDFKALRQAVLTLHHRYLVHWHAATVDGVPGGAMRLPFAAVGVFDDLVAEAEGRSVVVVSKAVSILNSLGSSVFAQAPATLTTSGGGGVDSESIATAFRQILEKLEKLETENQQLVELIATGAEPTRETTRVERERSPRSSSTQVIPSQGLPPWKRRV